MVDSFLPDAERLRRASTSFGELMGLFRRRGRVVLGILGGLLLLCVLYCLVVPNQYEAVARVALRMQSASSLTVDASEVMAPASILSTPLQLETLVNVLRSDQVAWRVIRGLKLHEAAGFTPGFTGRFTGFDVAKPSPEAQSYLLDAFARRLKVRTMPRTLMIEIRFKSRDPALAATVVNALIRGYTEQESDGRRDATGEASGWLSGQLTSLTTSVEGREKRLAAFEREHHFMSQQQTAPGGQPIETLHDPLIFQVDEAGRQFAAASGDRILREALYREAQQGNPELVLAANPELQAELGPGGATMVQQLRIHESEVGVELAQLEAEHGPNYPRVVELERASADLEAQIKIQDANLLEAFRRTWKAAGDREALLRKELDARTEEGLQQNDATIQYSVLHQQVEAGRELISRVTKRIQDATLSAGVRASSITVVDYARQPVKPVSPDLPLYLAITLFVGIWIGLGGALLMDALRPVASVMVLIIVLGGVAQGQAPTPNTSGLPTGVVRLPQTAPVGNSPDAQSAPVVWNAPAQSGNPQVFPEQGRGLAQVGPGMAMPIAVGDFLEVSEYHLAEFRSAVRVAGDGTVALPLVGPVKLLGMSEQAAAVAIARALLDGGVLLHPQVTVLVTQAVGQDVSVLGEVARPGVYAYTIHHRLLDLISAASGMTANAGRMVSVAHRDSPGAAQVFVLESPTGPTVSASAVSVKVNGKVDGKTDHNPELLPGDTVAVSRAGLVYVIGDVVRPGGFAVDPVQGLTIVQALSLAWGATPNASAGKAILIRDQAGGRTLTTLNLKRMIRGQDPDLAVRDRDILFVPDSAAKQLLSKTLESAIQSAVGVSIYAGLVYSQRF